MQGRCSPRNHVARRRQGIMFLSIFLSSSDLDRIAFFHIACSAFCLRMQISFRPSVYRPIRGVRIRYVQANVASRRSHRRRRQQRPRMT